MLLMGSLNCSAKTSMNQPMKMNWQQLYSPLRTGAVTPSQNEFSAEIARSADPNVRTSFLRDYDRLIFSSAFRRLQNKTQVFPLPGSTFVHNRLTHSLEVASVRRSLGKMVGTFLADNELGAAGADAPDRAAAPASDRADAREFYRYELSNVIAAACLAHDIGNPAFGHSGEKALSAWFSGNGQLQSFFSSDEWADLVNFEGNANAFRILTHSFNGKLPGGFGLTYTTLAAILKYPCDATAVAAAAHRKKYGFFQSERENFHEVADALHMIRDNSAPRAFFRHPFVYLTEAADDICYQVIDVEDAHRLGILDRGEAQELLMNLMRSIGRSGDNMEKVGKTGASINEPNEKKAYLRTRCIY